MSLALPRLIMFVGIVAILIIATGGSSPPGWADLQNTLSGGFPTFDNPFEAQSWTFIMGVPQFVGDPLFAPLNVRGDGATIPGFCEADEYVVSTDWYGCLDSPDANLTYVTTGLGGFSEGVDTNISAFPDSGGTWRVTGLSVTFQCKSDGSGIQFGFRQASNPDFIHIGDAPDETSCHVIGTIPNDDYNEAVGYENVTLTIDTTLDGIYAAKTPPEFAGRSFLAATVRIANGGTVGDTDLFTISYLSITIRYQRESGCNFEDAGNPWDNIVRATFYIGCVLGAFGQFLADAITFVINLVRFLGQTLIFFVTVVIQFVTGLTQVFTWLLGADPASPLYAAPEIIKLIVGVLVFGAMVYIIIEFMRLLFELIAAVIP